MLRRILALKSRADRHAGWASDPPAKNDSTSLPISPASRVFASYMQSTTPSSLRSGLTRSATSSIVSSSLLKP